MNSLKSTRNVHSAGDPHFASPEASIPAGFGSSGSNAPEKGCCETCHDTPSNFAAEYSQKSCSTPQRSALNWREVTHVTTSPAGMMLPWLDA
ncbi:MAG: hypothetical protein M5U18_10145 [Dehalococcoidia bacterium]|nr:hypothetical protein [Dehalococcoidia bacterium]